jgi:hypothetical protein
VKLMRADLGFRNAKAFKRLEDASGRYSIAVGMQKGIGKAVEQVDDEAWQAIDCPEEGEAQIAQTTYGRRRPIVRRTRLLGPRRSCGPNWPRFAFITNRAEEITIVEAERRGDHLAALARIRALRTA